MKSPRRRRTWTRIRRGLLAVAVAALVPAAVEAQTDTVEYYHLDALGSVRVVTNAAGQVVVRHDFLPFGEEWNPQPALNARKFTGKERDVETGLDYFGARYLSSKTARFTTTDPTYTLMETLADPQRWNRYAYVRNSPLTLVDPDGKNPVAVMGLIGSAVYIGWNAYENAQRGDPWHKNWGVEGAKGFVVGATLGLGSLLTGGAAGATESAVTAASRTSGAAAAEHAGAAVSGPIVRFGANPEQTRHALRHVLGETDLAPRAVTEAIRSSLSRNADRVGGALYQGYVEVGGVLLKYNAYRLKDGSINVGRITVEPM